MTLEDLTLKVSNNGASPQGKLTSEEYNVLLLAVKAHDSSLRDLLSVENVTLKDVEAYLEANDYITRDALAPYATSNSVSALLGNYLPLSSFTKVTIKSTLGISDWALASAKPTYSWDEINSRPTKLSQLTDDVVAGKYLPLSGGTVYGAFVAKDGVHIDMGVYGNAQLKFSSLNGSETMLYVKNGDWRITDDNFSYFRRLLHSDNFSDFALPKDGTAVAATKLATPRTIWGQSFDGTGNVDGDLTLNGGILSYNNGVWTLNGDLLVTGGVTQFAQGVKTATSIMDAIVVDDETITKRDGKLVAIGGSGEVTTVSLDASKLSVGSTFYISEAQFNAIKKSRKGIAVVVIDVNSAISDSEWGQVISCYKEYLGSSVYTYRVSILHKDTAPLSGADNAKLYNVDIMDSPQSSGYYCTMTSINNLY